MFCKSCGKEIKDTADFCSFCGTKIVKTQTYGNSSSLAVPDFQMAGNVQATPKKIVSLLQSKKMLPIVILFFCVVCVLSLFLVINSKKEYPLEGRWMCDDLADLPEIIREFAQNKGYSVGVANAIVEKLGLDDLGENMSLAFTEDNEIFFIIDGVTVGSDLLSYRKIGENNILLQIDCSAISIGYTGEYKIDKDKLSMDFFGHNVQMTRCK